jgi:hypothetical protein
MLRLVGGSISHLEGSTRAVEGKKIAIVGGGPGGLTLARLPQQSDAQISVYERDPSRSARVQGSALDLHEDSGLAALEAAGLIDVPSGPTIGRTSTVFPLPMLTEWFFTIILVRINRTGTASPMAASTRMPWWRWPRGGAACPAQPSAWRCLVDWERFCGLG